MPDQIVTPPANGELKDAGAARNALMHAQAKETDPAKKSAWQSLIDNVGKFYEDGKTLVMKDGAPVVDSMVTWGKEKGGQLADTMTAAGNHIAANARGAVDAIANRAAGNAPATAPAGAGAGHGGEGHEGNMLADNGWGLGGLLLGVIAGMFMGEGGFMLPLILGIVGLLAGSLLGDGGNGLIGQFLGMGGPQPQKDLPALTMTPDGPGENRQQVFDVKKGELVGQDANHNVRRAEKVGDKVNDVLTLHLNDDKKSVTVTQIEALSADGKTMVAVKPPKEIVLALDAEGKIDLNNAALREARAGAIQTAKAVTPPPADDAKTLAEKIAKGKDKPFFEVVEQRGDNVTLAYFGGGDKRTLKGTLKDGTLTLTHTQILKDGKPEDMALEHPVVIQGIADKEGKIDTNKLTENADIKATLAQINESGKKNNLQFANVNLPNLNLGNGAGMTQV